MEKPRRTGAFLCRLFRMKLDWLPQALVPIGVILALALFRKFAPRRADAGIDDHSHPQQGPEPLPTGVVGAAMWTLAIALALTFFLLRSANHFWATLDGPAILTVYATPFIWCFFAGFAALAIPWPLTVWYLRRVGRTDEATSMANASSARAGMDTFRVMKWLSFGLVGPIAFFTLLAIPVHLSIGETEARLGHYASWHSERFPFSEARRATMIDGYRLRNGTLSPARDLVIDFADGRRLSGNAVGDGDTDIPDAVEQLLLAKTGLQPQHAQTVNDIPPR
jgi:hypothetical protein